MNGEEYADEDARAIGRFGKLPLALGAYVLSDNIAFHESWEAVEERANDC